MEKEEITIAEEKTAQYAKALSHPVRIAILRMLATQSCCYHGDMSKTLPIAKSTLSQHLSALKEAGLIQGEIHPPAVRYCIHKTNWAEAKRLFDQFFNEKSI